MTREDVSRMIESIGLPFTFLDFQDDDEDRPDSPPYLCFFYPEHRDFFADGVVYVSISRLTIELNARDVDFGLEARVEAALTAEGLGYTKERARDDGEELYQTTYTTEVMIDEQG